MIKRRYQVFISSTYEDLKVERESIIKFLIRFKHFPSGMEEFSASNDEKFDYIKKFLRR